jgi:hypothetical protein
MIALNGTTVLGGNFQPQGGPSIDFTKLPAGSTLSVSFPTQSPLVMLQFAPTPGTTPITPNVLVLTSGEGGAGQEWSFGSYFAPEGLSVASGGAGVWIVDSPSSPLAPPSEFRALQ